MGRYAGFVRDNVRWAIYGRDSYRCGHCGLDMTDNHDQLSLDYVIPWETSVRTSGKADHRPQNLITCCKLCNSSRGMKPLRAFVQAAGILVRIMEQTSTALTREDIAAGQVAYLADRARRGYGQQGQEQEQAA